VYAAIDNTDAADEDTSWDPSNPYNVTSTWDPDWSIAAKLVLNQEVLCNTFHLTSKPYWLVLAMAVVSLFGTALFFGDGATTLPWSSYMGCLSWLYLFYTCASIIYEAVTLCLHVAGDVSFEPTFHSEPLTGWDRYEITMYLWAQSSVNANIASMLTACAVLVSFRPASEIVKEEDVNTTRNDDEADKIEAESMIYFKLCLFCSCFIFLIPSLVTHTIPMMLAYIYMWVGLVATTALFCVIGAFPMILLGFTLYNCCLSTLKGPQHPAISNHGQAADSNELHIDQRPPPPPPPPPPPAAAQGSGSGAPCDRQAQHGKECRRNLHHATDLELGPRPSACLSAPGLVGEGPGVTSSMSSWTGSGQGLAAEETPGRTQSKSARMQEQATRWVDKWSRYEPPTMCGDESPTGTLPLYTPLFLLVVYILTTQTMMTYGILLYGRSSGFYLDGIVDEYHSRDTAHYGNCLAQGVSLTVFDTIRGFI